MNQDDSSILTQLVLLGANNMGVVLLSTFYSWSERPFFFLLFFFFFFFPIFDWLKAKMALTKTAAPWSASWGLTFPKSGRVGTSVLNIHRCLQLYSHIKNPKRSSHAVSLSFHLISDHQQCRNWSVLIWVTVQILETSFLFLLQTIY